MEIILSLFDVNNITSLFKLLLLALMFVYILFTFIVWSRVRSLNRTIYLASANASALLNLLTLLSFLLAISLFIATLVIV